MAHARWMMTLKTFTYSMYTYIETMLYVYMDTEIYYFTTVLPSPSIKKNYKYEEAKEFADIDNICFCLL